MISPVTNAVLDEKSRKPKPINDAARERKPETCTPALKLTVAVRAVPLGRPVLYLTGPYYVIGTGWTARPFLFFRMLSFFSAFAPAPSYCVFLRFASFLPPPPLCPCSPSPSPSPSGPAVAANRETCTRVRKREGTARLYSRRGAHTYLYDKCFHSLSPFLPTYGT
ncbi:hypothetical protein LY78DRAFT_113702 [Colletotrichum sublineola]|nr:hypothetical protein LY78DRAFT_113702 [Colletotrichum sublineola]